MCVKPPVPVPCIELELDGDFEADEVDDAHLPPSPVPKPHRCELDAEEEEVGEEVVWMLLVLLAV